MEEGSRHSIVSELRAEIFSAKAVAAVTVGSTTGLGLVVAQIAYATLIFSGPLAGFSSQGVGLILFGNLVGCLLIALMGGFRGSIAGMPAALAVLMARVASIGEAEGNALFLSTVAAFMITAVTIGGCLYLLGRLGRANLLRFVPYPVSAGCVAGIGAAVSVSAMSLMGADTGWRSIPSLIEVSTLWKWGPGAAFGIALYWAMKRWGHPLILPFSVALAMGVFHLLLDGQGIDGEEARAMGLLLAEAPEGGLWPAVHPADFLNLDWSVLAMKVPAMLMMMLVALVVVVTNTAGLEVAINRDLDWDREFRVTGLASAVAGLGGGTVASIIVPASFRSELFGASTRLTGIVTALVVAATLFSSNALLGLVPVPVIGGILVFAGVSMLDQGLVKSRRRLPWSEYRITVLIVAFIVTFGLFEGVVAGMLATVVFFAVRLSRIDPIHSRFTARERPSRKVRPVPDRAILLEQGDHIRVYLLRGYIFFGSAYPLAEDLRRSMRGTPRPACLILDFSSVSGFDFSAVNVLARFAQAALAADVALVLSAAPEQMRSGLERALPPSDSERLLFAKNADEALERCEDIVIAAWNSDPSLAEERRAALLRSAGNDLERHLERLIRFEDLVDALGPWLTTQRYAPGETIAGPGTATAGLQLLTSGHATSY